jgi:hypothetical protein
MINRQEIFPAKFAESRCSGDSAPRNLAALTSMLAYLILLFELSDAFLLLYSFLVGSPT